MGSINLIRPLLSTQCSKQQRCQLTSAASTIFSRERNISRKKFPECQDSNPGPLGEKRERYLMCYAPPPPYAPRDFRNAGKVSNATKPPFQKRSTPSSRLGLPTHPRVLKWKPASSTTPTAPRMAPRSSTSRGLRRARRSCRRTRSSTSRVAAQWQRR